MSKLFAVGRLVGLFKNSVITQKGNKLFRFILFIIVYLLIFMIVNCIFVFLYFIFHDVFFRPIPLHKFDFQTVMLGILVDFHTNIYYFRIFAPLSIFILLNNKIITYLAFNLGFLMFLYFRGINLYQEIISQDPISVLYMFKFIAINISIYIALKLLADFVRH